MPDTPETILAFDFGLRRIGVGVGQQVTGSASPLETVRHTNEGPDWERIRALVEEWRPARLIVGMPGHADGSPSDMAATVLQFVQALARFNLPVDTVDERYSSVEAEGLLRTQRQKGRRGRISKEAIDSAAATLIAERWLKMAGR